MNKKGKTYKQTNKFGEFKCSVCGKFSMAKYWCTECKQEYNKKYHYDNKEKILKRKKIYERQRRLTRTDEQIEKRKEVARNWYHRNKEDVLKRNMDYLKKARNLVLNNYGNKCACCGETHKEFLYIHHINNDGGKHRKEVGRTGRHFYVWIVKNNYPKDLELLCYNCHMAETFYGKCPHEKENK